MEANSDEKLQIFHLNTNGIASKNEYIEWGTLLDSLYQVQADIFCSNETNIDTLQSQIYFDIQNRAKIQD